MNHLSNPSLRSGQATKGRFRGEHGARVERRNVRISGRRTTVKLEFSMWDALEEICAHTGRKLDDICSEVAQRHGARTNFTSELRLFILNYYRNASP